jgi:hypothetical protein
VGYTSATEAPAVQLAANQSAASVRRPTRRTDKNLLLQRRQPDIVHKLSIHIPKTPPRIVGDLRTFGARSGTSGGADALHLIRCIHINGIRRLLTNVAGRVIKDILA